jgi:hypothetical protein
MASIASLSLVLRSSTASHPSWAVILGPLATLGLMHIPFMVVFHPLVTAAGFHASYAMNAFRLLCALPLLPRLVASSRSDRRILAQFMLYVVAMASLALSCDPTSETRTSFSQPCAPKCHERESSFWGAFERGKYTGMACNAPAHDLYRVCDARCAKGAHETYTSCGVQLPDHWSLTILVHAVACLLLASAPFAPKAKRSGKAD